MGIQDRPYIGTWKLAGKSVVQHTPDALVYINGDLTIPGCPKCHGKINVQKYLTEVSVDAGTEPNAASATFTLAAPLHSIDPFIRDANFLLRPGLEVHIYMRGYFPVYGLFTSLAESQPKAQLTAPTVDTAPPTTGPQTDLPPLVNEALARLKLARDQADNAAVLYSAITNGGRSPATAMAVVINSYWECGLRLTKNDGSLNSNPKSGAAGFIHILPDHGIAGYDSTDPYVSAQATSDYLDYIGYKSDAGSIASATRHFTIVAEAPGQAVCGKNDDPTKPPRDGWADASDIKAWRIPPEKVEQGMTQREVNEWIGDQRAAGAERSLGKALADDPRFNQKATPPEKPVDTLPANPDDPGVAVLKPEDLGPSMLDQYGLGGMNLENLLAYPYYHVFHGVVTQVGHQYSGGTNNITVSCASMLHFWQYQNMSTNAAYFGAKPPGNDHGLKYALDTGHAFTGMHPYEIIYKLHHDIAGAAGGISWALTQKTNQAAVSDITGRSMFSSILRYWERRFGSEMVKLRMHGASGELFSALQAAFLASTPGGELVARIRSRFIDPSSAKDAAKVADQWMRKAKMVGWDRRVSPVRSIYGPQGEDVSADVAKDADPGLAAAFVQQGQASEGNGKDNPGLDVNVIEMQAFVSNITQWAQVNLFESTYESKLDIANKVCQVTGFEFFQDVDGDFVFKPPMFNLDTSSSRVYRIEDIDIISIQFDEKEPQATYIKGKGSQFKNMAGFGFENEWGVEGTYIDFRLVAQFGWRPADFETSYFNDARAVFWSAVNRLDVLNVPCNSASATIPVRPEVRPGYPFYIPYLDCFYYCNSFAHSYSVGGQSTTSLQLVGKRAKFFAPGDPTKRGIEAIDLGNLTLPEHPLEVLGSDGSPRLVGFPNVVMALDPSHLNPLFLAGQNFTKLQYPDELASLLTLAGTVLGGDLVRDGNIYELRWGTGENDKVTFYYQDPGSTVSGRVRQTGAEVPEKEAPDVTKWVTDYTTKMGTQEAEVEKIKRRVRDQGDKYNKAEATARKALGRVVNKKPDPDIKTYEAARKEQEAIRAEVARLKAQLDANTLAFQKTMGDGAKDGAYFIWTLVQKTRAAFLRTNPNYDDLDTTQNLLAILSDMKATFSPQGTQLPGMYRYYSVSHPDPQQQGQPGVQIKNNRVSKGPADLDPPWAGRWTDGFVKTSSLTLPTATSRKPEAQLGKVPMQAGLRVLTGRKKGTTGEVIPTSEIRELMFATHKVSQSALRSGGAQGDGNSLTGAKARDKAAGRFLAALKGSSDSDTVAGKAKPVWEALVKEIVPSPVPADLKVNSTWPLSISCGGLPLVTTSTFKEATKALSKKGNADTVKAVAGGLAAQFQTGVLGPLKKWNITRSKGAPAKADAKAKADAQKARTEARAVTDKAAKALGLSGAAPRPKATATVETEKGVPITSGVLPVSDKSGYRVIGAVRYGRDLGIDADGVWGQIHADPLSILDKDTLENVLGQYVRGERTPASKGQTPLEQKLLTQLRTVFSDRQIIDMGLATKAGTNQLQISMTNWLSTGHEGVQKLPVNNAAFSLADLTAVPTGTVCDCKAAEASYVLEMFGNQNFVKIDDQGFQPTPPGLGTTEMSQTTRWMTEQATAAAVPWRQSQDALRGAVLDRGSQSILSTFQDAVSAFQNADDDIRQKIDDLKAQAQQVKNPT